MVAAVVGFTGAGCLTPARHHAVVSTAAVTAPNHVVAEATRAPELPPTTTPAPVPPAALSAARAAAPSPWATLTAPLPGPAYQVAHARRPVPVAAVMGGAPVTVLSSATAIGAPRVFVVVADAGEWLQVLLPMRPNQSLGWILRGDVELVTVGLHVEIDRAVHLLRLFDNGVVTLEAPVAVGRAATPTPAGQFFVTELLRPPNPAGAYGPYAFTLSAYSTVYQRFGSGDGAVGVHGTNQPAAIGTDASHGCVRVPNDVITRLAAVLPLGTPVLIR